MFNLNTLMGIGSRGVNTTPISVSGLPAANRLREEAIRYEEQGDLEKAKECFEAGIREAEDLLQRTHNKSELRKTREQLAASHFFYGTLLRKSDKSSAEDHYKKALEYAPCMDLKQGEARMLYQQISARYGSFLIKDESVGQENSKQLDPTKALVENTRPSRLGLMSSKRQVDLSIQRKSDRADYLFEKALKTLGALKVANKPSMFLVYAHDNPAHGKAEASTSKYLIEKLSQIQVILYSDQTPMGQPYSSAARDLKKDGKLEDILTNQLCLLPGQLRGDMASVDKVVVCCSEVLGSYLKWSDYDNFYQKLREAYRKDREAYLKDNTREGASTIREVVREFSQERNYKAGFHHVLTEMAFLQIRAEELKDQHGIIPAALTQNSYDECLSDFISATAVRMEDIPRFEEQAEAGREVYVNQSRHGVLFKLIERLLAGSDEAQMFLNKFWQGYSDCMAHLKNDAMLDGLEFTQLVDHIFEDIQMAWHNQLAPAMQQIDAQLSDQSRDLTQIQAGLDSLIARLLGNLQENIQKLGSNYLEGLEKDREIKDALANYVSLEGMPLDDSTRFDLKSKVQDFLNSDKKVLLLLGEAGSGKSTFTRHLAIGLWEAYLQPGTVEGNPIPVFIQLSSLPESNRNLVEAFFETQGFSKEQIKALQSEHRFVLILDGFDEIQDRQRNFHKDNHLDDWKDAKIIVSSRPEYLGSNYQYKFHPSGERSALEEYRLAPFSEETIERCVDQYKKAHLEGPWSAEQYKEALKQPDLREIVGNPFLLKISLSVLPELSEKLRIEGQRYTRIALYEHFVEHWFERSQERLAQIGLSENEKEAFEVLHDEGFAEHGIDFSKELALEMYQAGEVLVTYSPTVYSSRQRSSAASEQDWRKCLLSNDEIKTRLKRLNAPLICQDKQNGLGKEYRFIHKSLRDYFIARGLWEELDAHGKMEGSSWLNRLNIVNDPAILQFLTERAQQERELKERLLEVVEQSKGEEGAQFERGAANALTVLVKAGVQFFGRDFNGIQVPGADLSYGVFDRVQFEEANLSGVQFRGAWLHGANMREAKLRDVEFGERPALEVGGMVYACSYSPDGRWLAVGTSGGRDYNLKIYDAQTLEIKYTAEKAYSRKLSNGVLSIAFSPDSQLLASAGFDMLVKLWSSAKSKLPIRVFTGHSAKVGSVAFSPDGQWLASGSFDKTVKLWAVQTGELKYTLEGYSHEVSSVSISPDGKWLASGDYGNAVKMWELGSTGALLCKTLKAMDADSIVLASDDSRTINEVVVSISPDGKWLASGNGHGYVYLWELRGTEALIYRKFRVNNQLLSSISFSSDSRWLISAGWRDGKVTMHELGRAKSLPRQDFTCDDDISTLSVSISPNSEWLASGNVCGRVKVWKLKRAGEPLRQTLKKKEKVWSVSISPDGKWLASGGEDYTVKVWELRSTGALLHQTLEGHHSPVWSVSISPDGKWLASGSGDHTVKVWELGSTGALLCQTLKGHCNVVWSVSISPDGRWLVSGSADHTVKVWKFKGEKEFFLHQTIKRHNSDVYRVLISPDSKWLVSGSEDRTVKVWKMGDAGSFSHQTLIGHSGGVCSLSISPDGKWLASGSYDRTVKVWELRGERWLFHRTLEGHGSEVYSLSISPDGKWLASGSTDKTLKVWLLRKNATFYPDWKTPTTIQGFIGTVNSIVWQNVAKNSARIVLGGGEGIVRIYQLERKKNIWRSNLCWTSDQNNLSLEGLLIKDAQGLSLINERLIAQRKGIGFSEENLDEVHSDEENSWVTTSEEDSDAIFFEGESFSPQEEDRSLRSRLG